MNKALAYSFIAIILGLLMTLIPTFFFLANADQYGNLAEVLGRFSNAENLRLPLLDYPEQVHQETVSIKEVNIFGISFVISLIIYVLYKRRASKTDYVWPPVHSY
ncbi:MAG: hypothetical protein JSV51_00645 [Candidatus Bathyarchaeota archaeon]|nr:MAG: hypothetical protein JSV51_00645 [Candidatus Bathyarchaeota archaeon]